MLGLAELLTRPVPLFGRPVAPSVRAVVSSGWSRPRATHQHRAIDVPLPVGTEVLALAPGVVVRAQATESGAAGIWCAVRHPDGTVTRYMHASRLLVELGAHVERGQPLMASGNTGDSAGPHLHLDVRVPRSRLAAVADVPGAAPAEPWGPEMEPYGVAIPAEPWVPVDGYSDRTRDEARAAGLRLWGARVESYAGAWLIAAGLVVLAARK